MRIPISADAPHERVTRDSDRRSRHRAEGSPYDSFELSDWYESEAPIRSTAGDPALRLLARILAAGYLRLLTARSASGLHLPTCLGDTTPRILDSPLDVSPPESDEWCGREPQRRPGCPTR